VRRRSLLAALGSLAAGGGCGAPVVETDTGIDPHTGDTAGENDAAIGPAPGAYAYPHLRPSGNRVVGGTGALPADPVDVPLEQPPAWILGLPAGDDAGGGPRVWVVVDRDGRARAFEVDADDRGVRERAVVPDRLPSGMPPVATVADGRVELLVPPEGAARRATPLGLESAVAHVAAGALVRRSGGERTGRVAVDALPDARPVRGGGRVFVLGDAAGRYAHGVLGDALEGGSIVVVDADAWQVHDRIAVSPAVVEGIAPIVADVDGDGRPEAVVTLSDADSGARVVAFGPDGPRVATGPAIGRGYRWRHQLAVAPFGPAGGVELAAVRTPHIGGTAEFYRLRDGRFEVVAERSGYSSHPLDSRNLDGGLAGDLDGDGRVELLVPTDDRRSLAALRRTDGGVTEAFRLAVGAPVLTNVHAVAADGLAVAVGRADALRVWQ